VRFEMPGEQNSLKVKTNKYKVKKKTEELENWLLENERSVIDEFSDETELNFAFNEAVDILTYKVKIIYSHMWKHFKELKMLHWKTPEANNETVFYSNFITFCILRNKCNCQKNCCEKKHNIKAWLNRKDEGLSFFLSNAVWGYYKMKGYAGSLAEGMFFHNFKKDHPVDRLLLLFNACPHCSGEKTHYYRGESCSNTECRKAFDENNMKRYLREWFVRTDEYENAMLYKCNNQECNNYYFHYHNKCPLCSKAHPQRTTEAFQRKKQFGRSLKDSAKGYDAEINNIQIKLWNQDKKEENLKNNLKTIFEQTVKTRPWMWALIISMAKDELPEFDEIRDVIVGDWHPDKYQVDLYELILDAFVKNKTVKITMGQITKCLLGYSIEMQKRGINRGANFTDVRSGKEQIGKFIADCLKENN
jgi:hypothetical protein